MFSFNKPLKNIIGAAYLSGALEGINKIKGLDETDSEKYFKEAKEVRRVLLDKAESDGYKEPVKQIEEAKVVAKEVLNSQKSTTTTNVKNTNNKKNKNMNMGMTNHKNMNMGMTNHKNMNMGMSNHKNMNTTTPSEMNTIHSEEGISFAPAPSSLKENELLPITNTPTAAQVNKPVLPPVLQLGGKNKKNRKTRKTRKVRKSRKSRK